MFSAFSQADQELFMFLNGLHSPFWDSVMAMASSKTFWFPMYAVMLAALVAHYKWKVIPVLLAITLCIAMSDQISSAVFKPFFERLRPCHNPIIENDVHVINGCGGMYGFVSSHAANTFGLATFLWLLFRRRFPWVKWMFLWSALVGYSRIYVGVHYPLDILGGCAVGAFAAVISYKIYLTLGGKYNWLKQDDIRLKARGWADPS